MDLDWTNDEEWNTVTEVSSGISNINLNSKFNQQEGVSSHKEEQSTPHSAKDWSRQTVPGPKSTNVENSPDNVPILTPEHVSYLIFYIDSFLCSNIGRDTNIFCILFYRIAQKVPQK